MSEELAVGVCRCREAARQSDTGIGQIGNHFPERGVLAADALDVSHAETIEPFDVLFQETPLFMCNARHQLHRTQQMNATLPSGSRIRH